MVQMRKDLFSKVLTHIEARQPPNYNVAIEFIVPHGKGIVVGYNVDSPSYPGGGGGRQIEHRCVGFLFNDDIEGGLHCRFDMIV